MKVKERRDFQETLSVDWCFRPDRTIEGYPQYTDADAFERWFLKRNGVTMLAEAARRLTHFGHAKEVGAHRAFQPRYAPRPAASKAAARWLPSQNGLSFDCP